MRSTLLQLYWSTMETVVHKLPSFHIINPTSCCSTIRSPASLRVGLRRSSSSLSVSASAVREGDPALGTVSLGHVTRPDFPILHQVLSLLQVYAPFPCFGSLEKDVRQRKIIEISSYYVFPKLALS